MTWEERMTARASTRASQARQLLDQQRRWSEADREWARQRAAARAAALRDLAGMTLGEATEYMSAEMTACACTGPPVCCWEYAQHAEQVIRAAHIAVKQVSELTAQRFAHQFGA